MVQRLLGMTMAVAAVMVACTLVTDGQQAFAQGMGPFYNHYVGPGPDGTVGAKLYPCPRPTPPLIGHTYITYEPLNPHEFRGVKCWIVVALYLSSIAVNLLST